MEKMMNKTSTTHNTEVHDELTVDELDQVAGGFVPMSLSRNGGAHCGATLVEGGAHE
jgi:hypothetical protein